MAYRRVLGAALAAACTAKSVAVLDAPETPSAVVSRAKRVLSDARHAAPARAATPRRTATSPAEAARAKAVLERYYALSAEAHRANVPAAAAKSGDAATLPPSPKQESPPGKKHPVPRAPAHEVFEPFDTSVPVAPFCKKYVICGGGTAAWAAIEAILETDPEAANQIMLITDEDHFPYNRTVLSKELWEEDKKNLFREEAAAKLAVEYGYRFAKPDQAGKVSLVKGRKAVMLDVDEKALTLSDGTTLCYDKLLLATGGAPRGGESVSPALAAAEVADDVGVFRTLDDYRALKASLEKDDTGVVVIGGGFLGTELAIALAYSSNKVSLVVGEAGVLYRVLPRYLCQYLARRLSNIGVKVVRGAVVTGAKRGDDGVVTLDVDSTDAKQVRGGKVVVAVGIEPRVEVARRGGLEIDADNGGVVVNGLMMAEADVFAAGDVASFHDRCLGRRRVEHWDHAVVSGRIAGANMAGGRRRYGLQSMFWSDLGNIGVSMTAVGRVESELETVAVWNLGSAAVQGAPSANEFMSGVVYYVQGGEVVGAVLWNAKKGSGGLRRARALIDAKTSLDGMDADLLGALVNLEDGRHRTAIRTAATAVVG